MTTKLTPEGAAALAKHHEFRLDDIRNREAYWNTIAAAAIEASPEVQRLRIAAEAVVNDASSMDPAITDEYGQGYHVSQPKLDALELLLYPEGA